MGSDLMVKWLSPLEEVSPFKLGQIQILISDINKEAGQHARPRVCLGSLQERVLWECVLR